MRDRRENLIFAVIVNLFWLAAVVVASMTAGLAGMAIIDAAPSGWLADEAVVTLKRDDPKPVEVPWSAIGRRDPPSGLPAFTLRRTADGGWTLTPPPGGVAAALAGPQRRRLDALPLAEGLRLKAGDSELRVAVANGERLAVESLDGRRRLEVGAAGETAMTPPPVLPTCRVDRLAEEAPTWRLRLDERRRLLQAGPAEPMLTWGGAVDCPGRWALPALPPGALGLNLIDGRWALTPLGPDADMVSVLEPGGGGFVPAFAGRAIRLPLETAGQGEQTPPLLFGRLAVSARAEGDRLVLTPLSGRVRLDWQPFAADPRVAVADRAVAWLGASGGDVLTDAAAWRRIALFAAVGAVLAGGGAAAALGWMAGVGIGGAAGVAAASFGVASMSADPPVEVWGALAGAGWLWATVVLAAGGRLRGAFGPLWLFCALLAAAGCLLHLQMAAGGAEEARLSAAVGQLQGALVVALGAAVAASIPAATAQRLLARRLGAEGPPWAWLWAAAGLCLLAAVHAVWGRETGLAGLQPAEVFKSAWLALVAAAAAWFLRLARLGAMGTRWGRTLALLGLWLGLPAAALAGALWVVDDHSPLAVLALSSAVMLVLLTLRCVALYRGAERRVSRWALLPPALLSALLLLAAAGVAYRSFDRAGSGPDDAVATGVTVVGSRFDVWERPELYPNSGEQVRRAQAALSGLPLLPELARGPQVRCEADPPAAALGRNCREQTVPAVENDFVVTFWLAHAGRAGAAALLAAQWGALLALAALARRAGRTAGAVGDFLYLGLAGFAAALACQWAAGWGNPTGLLPVMGQPATFLSTGNSHAVFFALPCVFLAVLAAAVIAADGGEDQRRAWGTGVSASG